MSTTTTAKKPAAKKAAVKKVAAKKAAPKKTTAAPKALVKTADKPKVEATPKAKKARLPRVEITAGFFGGGFKWTRYSANGQEMSESVRRYDRKSHLLASIMSSNKAPFEIVDKSKGAGASLSRVVEA